VFIKGLKKVEWNSSTKKVIQLFSDCRAAHFLIGLLMQNHGSEKNVFRVLLFLQPIFFFVSSAYFWLKINIKEFF
jgi:hypothetical protein